MTIHNINDIPGRVVAFRCAKPHREGLGDGLTAWRIGRGVWAIVRKSNTRKGNIADMPDRIEYFE